MKLLSTSRGLRPERPRGPRRLTSLAKAAEAKSAARRWFQPGLSPHRKAPANMRPAATMSIASTGWRLISTRERRSQTSAPLGPRVTSNYFAGVLEVIERRGQISCARHTHGHKPVGEIWVHSAADPVQESVFELHHRVR